MINLLRSLHLPYQWATRRLAATGLAVAGLCGLVAPVQALDEEPNWFQIEVILFANEAPRWQEAELWRNQFAPSYPNDLVILKPYREYEFEELDADFSALRRSMPGEPEPIESDFSTLKREYISPQRRAELEQLELEEASSFSQFGQAYQDTLDQEMPEIEQQSNRLSEPMDLERDPFILVPEKYLRMQASASRIKNASDLRLLGHFAWRQPLGERSRGVPVLVQAGDQFGLDFEIEGTLTASENRFLHLESDLHFSRFERSLVTDTSNWRSFYETPANSPGTLPGTTRPGFSTAFEARGVDIFDQQATADFQRTLSAGARDSRRLKNGELHYIDHPLFGILVKMTPYELPDPVMAMKDFNLDALPQKKPVPVPVPVTTLDP